MPKEGPSDAPAREDAVWVLASMFDAVRVWCVWCGVCVVCVWVLASMFDAVRGWLAGWLDGWLDGWLAGWLIGRLLRPPPEFLF